MTKLEELRTAQGLTQVEIASNVGIAVSTYSLYENGHRCVPLKTAERIAEIVGCAVADIFLPERFTVSKTKDAGQEKMSPAVWAGDGR